MSIVKLNDVPVSLFLEYYNKNINKEENTPWMRELKNVEILEHTVSINEKTYKFYSYKDISEDLDFEFKDEFLRNYDNESYKYDSPSTTVDMPDTVETKEKSVSTLYETLAGDYTIHQYAMILTPENKNSWLYSSVELIENENKIKNLFNEEIFNNLIYKKNNDEILVYQVEAGQQNKLIGSIIENEIVSIQEKDIHDNLLYIDHRGTITTKKTNFESDSDKMESFRVLKDRSEDPLELMPFKFGQPNGGFLGLVGSSFGERLAWFEKFEKKVEINDIDEKDIPSDVSYERDVIPKSVVRNIPFKSNTEIIKKKVLEELNELDVIEYFQYKDNPDKIIARQGCLAGRTPKKNFICRKYKKFLYLDGSKYSVDFYYESYNKKKYFGWLVDIGFENPSIVDSDGKVIVILTKDSDQYTVTYNGTTKKSKKGVDSVYFESIGSYKNIPVEKIKHQGTDKNVLIFRGSISDELDKSAPELLCSVESGNYETISDDSGNDLKILPENIITIKSFNPAFAKNSVMFTTLEDIIMEDNPRIGSALYKSENGSYLSNDKYVSIKENVITKKVVGANGEKQWLQSIKISQIVYDIFEKKSVEYITTYSSTTINETGTYSVFSIWDPKIFKLSDIRLNFGKNYIPGEYELYRGKRIKKGIYQQKIVDNFLSNSRRLLNSYKNIVRVPSYSIDGDAMLSMRNFSSSLYNMLSVEAERLSGDILKNRKPLNEYMVAILEKQPVEKIEMTSIDSDITSSTSTEENDGIITNLTPSTSVYERLKEYKRFNLNKDRDAYFIERDKLDKIYKQAKSHIDVHNDIFEKPIKTYTQHIDNFDKYRKMIGTRLFLYFHKYDEEYINKFLSNSINATHTPFIDNFNDVVFKKILQNRTPNKVEQAETTEKFSVVSEGINYEDTIAKLYFSVDESTGNNEIWEVIF